MSLSGFSFPNTGQNPQQNTGTQGPSGSTFGSFAAGLGGGGNTTSTGGGLFGGGTGANTGAPNAAPPLFGAGTMTGTTSGNVPGGGLFGAKPATGGGPFGNLGPTGTTLGGTTAFSSTNMPSTAPTTSTSGLFGAFSNPSTGLSTTPSAAATTFGFNKPPEGAAPPATSNALGLNTATTNTSNSAAPGGSLFGNKAGATGGGLFGNLPSSTNPAATTTAGTTGGGLFGSSFPSGTNTNTTSGGFGLFGGLKPGGTTATTTTAPTMAAPSGGLFNTKPTTAVPNTGTASGSNLFGSLKPPGATATGTGTAAGPSIGTGSTATSTTAPVTTGSNPFAPKTDAATTTTSAAPASTSAAPGLGGLFGGPKPTLAPGAGLGIGTASSAPAAGTAGTSTTAQGATTTTTTDAAKDAAKPPLGLGFGGSTLFSGLSGKAAVTTIATATTPTAAQAAATPTTAKTPTAPPVPAPSVLRGKTIEEVTRKWATELDDQAKEFAAVASEVAQWDRALVENGQYISTLYSKILEAEATQNAIDQNLDHVEQQQKELIAQLDKYEKETKEIFDGPTGGLRVIDMGPADAERDRNYTLAANLNLQLDELSKSLSQMIESVNALTLPNSPHATSSDPATGGKKADDDPLQQIGAVLNAHLKSLQWIDETIRDVEDKVKEAERRVDGSAMSVSVLGRGGFLLGETMRAGTPGGELPASFAGMALRQSEGPRARGFGLSTTMRR